MTTDTPRYLLDTHAWFWLALGDARILKDTVGRLETAAIAGHLFLCQISIWEIALKEAQGKIQLNRALEVWCQENTEGIALLDLPPAIAIAATRLPGAFHKDPADRIIVATARHHGLTLVTGDGLILTYAALGHVDVLPL
jgi:PIN domain nuclease of toxin-antitoxin system